MTLEEALAEIERRDEIINSYKYILMVERQLNKALQDKIDHLNYLHNP